MGIDLLDITFRVEREFEIEIPQDALLGLAVERPGNPGWDFQVEAFVELVASIVRVQHEEPVHGVFERTAKHIAKALMCDLDEVRPEAWMVADLGME